MTLLLAGTFIYRSIVLGIDHMLTVDEQDKVESRASVMC